MTPNITVTLRYRDGREETVVHAEYAEESEDAGTIAVKYLEPGTDDSFVIDEYDALDWRIVDTHLTETWDE